MTFASDLEIDLRQRFGALREDASDEADTGDMGAPPVETLTPAAVLVPLVRRTGGLTVLLTQRTAHLRDHGGQVSFPGGRCELSDADAEATALRETQEEVGLSADRVEVIGRLPRYRTGTGFVVTPVVAFVTPPLDLKLDDFEVAEVFEPPLDFLLDPAHHKRHSLEYRGAVREFWAIPWREYYIWGATAGMLVSLARVAGTLAADAAVCP